MDSKLDAVLSILNDKKPTAVRQALSALHDVAMYKTDLHALIREKVLKIDYRHYKDTMQGLIKKDIDALLKMMDES